MNQKKWFLLVLVMFFCVLTAREVKANTVVYEGEYRKFNVDTADLQTPSIEIVQGEEFAEVIHNEVKQKTYLLFLKTGKVKVRVKGGENEERTEEFDIQKRRVGAVFERDIYGRSYLYAKNLGKKKINHMFGLIVGKEYTKEIGNLRFLPRGEFMTETTNDFITELSQKKLKKVRLFVNDEADFSTGLVAPPKPVLKDFVMKKGRLKGTIKVKNPEKKERFITGCLVFRDKKRKLIAVKQYYDMIPGKKTLTVKFDFVPVKNGVYKKTKSPYFVSNAIIVQK